MLTNCAPASCINKRDHSTTSESSDVLNNELLQSVEVNYKLRHAVEKLIIEFKDLFSETHEDVGRTILTQPNSPELTQGTILRPNSIREDYH